MGILYWHAFPILRGGERYYRYVWKLFGKGGIPIWWRDKSEPGRARRTEAYIDVLGDRIDGSEDEDARQRMMDEAEQARLNALRMNGLSDVRCAVCGTEHTGGCRLYATFVSEQQMFARLAASVDTHPKGGDAELGSVHG